MDKKNTRQAEIDRFFEETGYRLTEREDGYLVYDGDLDLYNSNITELPENLEVVGYLVLEGCTSLTHLPEGIKVGMSLNLRDCTALTHLPDGLQVVGYLNLIGCTALTELPNGLKVV